MVSQFEEGLYDNNGRRPQQKLFLANYSSSSDKIIIMEIVGLQNTYLYFHLFIYFLKLIQVFSFPVWRGPIYMSPSKEISFGLL